MVYKQEVIEFVTAKVRDKMTKSNKRSAVYLIELS